MKPITSNSLVLISSMTALLALGGCDRDSFNSAVNKTEQAASRTAEAGKDAARQAGGTTKSMGAGAAAKVDDAKITSSINTSLIADKDLKASRIDVDTRNGVVTLSGLAPNATAKERATEIASKADGVTSVNNQLTVKSN